MLYVTGLLYMLQSADHLAFSYKFGSFLKISEFVEFRDRLNNSIHNSLVAVEKKLLEIFHTSSFQKTLGVCILLQILCVCLWTNALGVCILL